MPAQWTASIISEMHLSHITQKQLAEFLGMTPEYVSMILNGHREPAGAEQRFRKAISDLQGQDSTGRVQQSGQSKS